MANTTATEVERCAALAVEDARNLMATMNRGSVRSETAEYYGLDQDSDWIDLLDVMALEVYATKRVGHGQPDYLRSITVVTGTGGPHVEFEVYPNGDLEGRAYWGSDKATAYGQHRGLYDALSELVGEVS